MTDPLAHAVERNSELERVCIPELDGDWQPVFTCCVCNRVRREVRRYEPDSDVCEDCAEEAGL